MSKVIGIIAALIGALLIGYLAGNYQGKQSLTELTNNVNSQHEQNLQAEIKRLEAELAAAKAELATAKAELAAAKTELAAPKPAQADTYTVVKGDSLSKIAKTVLGDESKWTTLFRLNEDRIGDPDLIFPGQVLKLRL